MGVIMAHSNVPHVAFKINLPDIAVILGYSWW